VIEFAKPPKTVWLWQVFGSEAFVVHLQQEVSWLARKTCQVMLGSKWVKP